ncbi:MAG: tRNA-binding protein [Anaerolineales bacterium]
MGQIEWNDFKRVDMRVGRVLQVEDFEEARNPSYLLQIDFGPEIGIKQSAAAIRDLYSKEQLQDRLIVGVVNFPPRQVANHISEVLVLAGVNPDSSMRLLQPDAEVELGARVR